MAVVAMPPLNLPTPRSAGSAGSGRQAGGQSTFRHLKFDSARGPGDKTAERDRLRTKLVDVGKNFIGFDKVVEEDTVRRRQVETQKHSVAQEGLTKLEKAMNCEIKRRVEANKQVQSLTENLANEMLERLQSNIHMRIEKLAASIESLTLRCVALERGIAQFRGELPSKLQVDTAALVKEISELRKHWEQDRKQRIDKDTMLLRRIEEIHAAEDKEFEQGAERLEQQFHHLKDDINRIARSEESSDSRTEKFRAFVLQEIAGMKNTLAISAQARESTDDEIVQAMNQYTNALQKGLHSANSRG
uniref:SF-assemblin n=1 Tax=Alexandrium monilatum TaxID=311494 RepID=A0A7S4Q1Y8_9DINO